jgi:hypothetical protein
MFRYVLTILQVHLETLVLVLQMVITIMRIVSVLMKIRLNDNLSLQDNCHASDSHNLCKLHPDCYSHKDNTDSFDLLMQAYQPYFHENRNNSHDRDNHDCQMHDNCLVETNYHSVLPNNESLNDSSDSGEAPSGSDTIG